MGSIFPKNLAVQSGIPFLKQHESYTAIRGEWIKKMLEVNDLNKMKVTGSNEKNKSMENTMNTRETALLIVATQVEDFDDLLKVQAETGLDMAELETMYYSII